VAPTSHAALERIGEGEARSSQGGKGDAGGAHRGGRNDGDCFENGSGGYSPAAGGELPAWQFEGKGGGVIPSEKGVRRVKNERVGHGDDRRSLKGHCTGMGRWWGPV
jgi:hypothetical protein